MALYLAFLVLIGSAVCNPIITDEEYDHDKAMQNANLFEGDIMGIDPDADRNAIPRKTSRWPNGIIPYKIAPELRNQESMIRNAMRNIESRTCIRFRPATARDTYYLDIFIGRGCYSFVGCLYKPQKLSLGYGCHIHSIAVHELMHAVGFYHEHSRSDRDDYIEIFFENISPESKYAFRKLAPNENILFDRFDFNSIMLYSDDAFSKGGGAKTMRSKIPGQAIPNVYRKPGMSNSDVYRVNQLYECK